MLSFHNSCYVDISLQTVALDTPNDVAVFVTDAPAKRAPTICSLSKSDRSPIFIRTVTQHHNFCTDTSTTV
jgi:hypothetical protein